MESSGLTGLPIDRLATRSDAIVLLFGTDRLVVGVAVVRATTAGT